MMMPCYHMSCWYAGCQWKSSSIKPARSLFVSQSRSLSLSPSRTDSIMLQCSNKTFFRSIIHLKVSEAIPMKSLSRLEAVEVMRQKHRAMLVTSKQ